MEILHVHVIVIFHISIITDLAMHTHAVTRAQPMWTGVPSHTRLPIPDHDDSRNARIVAVLACVPWNKNDANSDTSWQDMLPTYLQLSCFVSI